MLLLLVTVVYGGNERNILGPGGGGKHLINLAYKLKSFGLQVDLAERCQLIVCLFMPAGVHKQNQYTVYTCTIKIKLKYNYGVKEQSIIKPESL